MFFGKIEMAQGTAAVARLAPPPKQLWRTREGGWRAERLRAQEKYLYVQMVQYQ